MAKKGVFITIEGIDGSGKSTQARLLFRRMKEHKYPVVLTREPGGISVEISEKIRNIILNHTSLKMEWKTELLLFMASRSQHVEELIRPNLEKGIHVICDRFADASLTYQGYGRGLNLDWIAKLNEFSCGGVQPVRTFLLDITPEEFGIRKQKDNKRIDRIECAGKEFQTKVRHGYLELAKQNPKRFICFNGSETEDKLSEKIFADVISLLEQRKESDK